MLGECKAGNWTSVLLATPLKQGLNLDPHQTSLKSLKWGITLVQFFLILNMDYFVRLSSDFAASIIPQHSGGALKPAWGGLR